MPLLYLIYLLKLQKESVQFGINNQNLVILLTASAVLYYYML